MTSSDNDNTEWKSSLLAGSLTESKSLKSLSIFLKQKVQGVDIILLEELGLVQSKANTSCGASLDGVMEVKFPSWLTSKLCVVEINTRVNKKTQAAADMIRDSYGSFVECDFLTDDFINMVEADHRIQILHNVAVVGLTDALYVVGTTETITYVVL